MGSNRKKMATWEKLRSDRFVMPALDSDYELVERVTGTYAEAHDRLLELSRRDGMSSWMMRRAR